MPSQAYYEVILLAIPQEHADPGCDHLMRGANIGYALTWRGRLEKLPHDPMLVGIFTVNTSGQFVYPIVVEEMIIRVGVRPDQAGEALKAFETFIRQALRRRVELQAHLDEGEIPLTFQHSHSYEQGLRFPAEPALTSFV